MASMNVVMEMLAFLAKARPGTKLEDGMEGAYWQVLEPICDEHLVEATMIYARKSGAFLPSAGDLYQAALDLMDDSPPEGEAWRQALALASLPRLYDPAAVEVHPLAREALEAVGGREMLAQAKESENAIHRARFLEQYRLARQRRRDRALTDPARLLGDGLSS